MGGTEGQGTRVSPPVTVKMPPLEQHDVEDRSSNRQDKIDVVGRWFKQLRAVVLAMVTSGFEVVCGGDLVVVVVSGAGCLVVAMVVSGAVHFFFSKIFAVLMVLQWSRSLRWCGGFVGSNDGEGNVGYGGVVVLMVVVVDMAQ
ncbi:Hypothetical predicted protein [Olea europaea subsp. europaea]|uniref:Transmembrane protein n=1 Tax=Olea europaea subsp. europaea TaxID=158383 RepID=A0A8S0PNX1_OLEEU|nr:Hypothetical predicted protein [Olea europaea subsp. europaea]